jgi:hypothetical protein
MDIIEVVYLLILSIYFYIYIHIQMRIYKRTLVRVITLYLHVNYNNARRDKCLSDIAPV